MTKSIDRNAIKASNLTLVTAGLTLIQFLLVGHFTLLMIFGIIFSIAIICVLAYLARQGYEPFKWVYLVLYIFELRSAITVVSLVFKTSLIGGFVLILHYVLQAIVLIFLFKVKKKTLIEPIEASEIPENI